MKNKVSNATALILKREKQNKQKKKHKKNKKNTLYYPLSTRLKTDGTNNNNNKKTKKKKCRKLASHFWLQFQPGKLVPATAVLP